MSRVKRRGITTNYQTRHDNQADVSQVAMWPAKDDIIDAQYYISAIVLRTHV